MKVFLDHDGGIDDFLALLLLLTYEHVDLLGVSVTPADTFVEAAVPATRKILDLAGRSDVATATGTLPGVNPFPTDWRADAYKVDALPVLNQRRTIAAPHDERPGHEFLADEIVACDEPVTLVMVGPLTNLAWALEHRPGIVANIDRLVWMGGALDVPGNVSQQGHDGTAEWNVFWDPPAAKRVWDSDLSIAMFPLDATNTVPVTTEFVQAFGRQYAHPLSAAAGSIWALTAGHAARTGTEYYCWDTLTVGWLACPDLVAMRTVRCDVIAVGASQGRTLPTAVGREVRAADKVDAEGFFAHCLDTLRR